MTIFKISPLYNRGEILLERCGCMEDKNIIQLFEEKPEQAIEETLNKYGRYIYVIALWVTGKHEDAEECLNDSLLILWKKIPCCKPECFLAYVKKIAYRVALGKSDYNKAAKRNQYLEESFDEYEQFIQSYNNLDTYLETKSIRNAVKCFYNSLSEEKRAVFNEKYIEGKSILQISGRYNMSESKVKMMLLRMRKELEKYLNNENIYL